MHQIHVNWLTLYILCATVTVVLVWYSEVFLIKRLKLGFSGERCDSPHIGDGLGGNLWEWMTSNTASLSGFSQNQHGGFIIAFQDHSCDTSLALDQKNINLDRIKRGYLCQDRSSVPFLPSPAPSCPQQRDVSGFSALQMWKWEKWAPRAEGAGSAPSCK